MCISPKRAILSQKQFGSLLENIREDYVQLVVIIGMCLGLRFSEVLALRWRDVDWKESEVHVRRAIVQGREGDVKTEYSEAPTPLDPVLAEVLKAWQHKTEFSKQENWVFASPFTGGQQPYFPYGSTPEDIKDLMRHGDIRTTFNLYGNVMQEPMREANSKVVQMALRARAV